MAKNVDYLDWKVQLAYSYTGNELKPGEWFSLSEKVNGVRATYFDKNLVSRSGKTIIGVEHILDVLEILTRAVYSKYQCHFVFDGELRLQDTFTDGLDDNEIFKASAGIANSSKNLSEKYKLKFVIFDVIPVGDFVCEKSYVHYSNRLNVLNFINSQLKNVGCVEIVKIMYSGTDKNSIDAVMNDAIDLGWEGIMINRDLPYEFKRTKNILKYKLFKTIDLKVIGYTEGTGKYAGTLGALECSFNGNSVFVGTGFDDSTRNLLWASIDSVIGRICEVKYKDITSDKSTGLQSLQFPVFVCLKNDKTKADA
jgi:DNA ligase-1